MKKITNSIKNILNKSFSYLKASYRTPQFYLNLGFIAFILALFYINSFHESYPDEFDNILGGKLILEGLIPYSGFFSHHGPVPYFLAAIIEIITGPSFVKVRIIYGIILALFTLLSFYYFRHKFGIHLTKFYGYFIVLLAFTSTYFWGHMLVADSFAAFLLIPPIALLILTGLTGKKLHSLDLWIVSILTTLALLTALTYLYVAIIIYTYTLFLLFRQESNKLSVLTHVKSLLILGIPFFLFLLYLLVTGSLSDYVTQSIIFNQKYYIYNYPGETTSLNPLRYAITITYRFYLNFTTLLYQTPSFNLGFPFNISLALANAALIIMFISKRKFTLTLFLIGVLIFSNARSNPLESGEEDYQAAVYIITSLFSICLGLYLFYKELRDDNNFAKKTIYTFCFLLLGIYSIATALFVIQKFSTKAYDKYMGTASLIYDRPEVSNYLNSVIQNDETIWYGPLEFKEMLYSNGKLPSQYHMLIPGIGRSEELSKKFVASYQDNPPRLIWFNKRFSILGQSPSDFAPGFIDFLDKNYLTIEQISSLEKKYTSVIPVELNRDFETMLYIRNDKVSETIPQLLHANIIKN